MIDRDKFGHCVKCHDYLLREVIDRGKVVLARTVDFDTEMLLLDDTSQMRVTICKKCKEELKDEDFPELMESVVAGWEWETDQLVADENKPQWTAVEKKEYMDRHRSLGVVTRPQGISKTEIGKRVKKFKKDKVKKVK